VFGYILNKIMINRRSIVVPIAVIVFVFAILVMFQLMLNYYYSKKIIKKMEIKVSESTRGKYLLSIGSLHISLVGRTISFENIAFIPTDRNDTLNNLYVVRISSAKLAGFSFFSYLKNKRTEYKKLTISNSEICILLKSDKIKTDNNNRNKSDQNTELLIPEAIVQNLKFNIIRHNSDPSLILKSEKNNIRVQDFKLLPEGDSSKPRFSFENADLKLNGIELHTSDKMYTINAEELICSSGTSLLTINNIHVTPNFSKAEFFKIEPEYITMSKVSCAKIEMSGLDVKGLICNKFLHSAKLNGSDLVADVYRDDNYPVKKKVKPSAQAAIRNIPFLVLIDSVFVEKAEINYEELGEGEAKTDKISLNKINARIAGITNDSTSYNANSKVKAKISGYFMNKGLLTTNYSFNLNTRKENFVCSGSLGAMEMANMNPMFRHSKNLIIKTGMIDSASFSFIAGPSSASGKMRLIYHNLSIESVPDKNSSGNGKLKTFLLNNFVIEEKNPEGGEIRTADIITEHDPYRWFPYYSRQAIMSGLVNSIISQKKSNFLKKVMK
jgi:hypothetical protein